MKHKHITSGLTSGLGLLLFGLSIWTIANQLKTHSLNDLWQSFNQLSSEKIASGIMLTGLVQLVKTGYDTLAFYHIKKPPIYPKIALVSLIVYGISPSIGFPALTGGAIRYRLYSNMLSGLEVAQVIVLSSISFWVGLLGTCGIVFTTHAPKIPPGLKLPITDLYIWGWLFIGLIISYICLTMKNRLIKIRNHQIFLPSWKVSIGQVIVFFIDWSLAASVLYVLFPNSIQLTYTEMLTIYILATFAGLVSHVPGGLGIFETTVLLAVSAKLAAPQTLAILLAFRGIYYIIPLILGVILLGLYEIRQRRQIT